jgi:hypothetical protein
MPADIIAPVVAISAFFMTFIIGMAYGCIASNLPTPEKG